MMLRLQFNNRVALSSCNRHVFGLSAAEDSEKDEGDGEDAGSQHLPKMKKDDQSDCIKAVRRDSKTKAPSRFSEGSLTQAMENIHKFVDDKDHKKMLRDGDGIGTSATRASIIEELKCRNFLADKGKTLVSTELGRSMIDALPEVVKSPVLTAMFERMLLSIEQGSGEMQLFMQKQETLIRDQVEKANKGTVKIAGAKQAAKVSTVHFCTQCKKGLIRRDGKKTNTHFWACSGYPTCTASFPDFKGKPNLTKPNLGKSAVAAGE